MVNISCGIQKFLPKCLLREPLTPEQQQNLGDEEKRIYNTHKAKYSVVQKIKAKIVPQTFFTLNEARKIHAGNYHEEKEEEREESDDGDKGKKKIAVTRYILRDDDFKENLNLHDFERAALE